MRGQYFSFDAIVASVIFILALVTLLSTWHSLRTGLEHQSSPLGFEALRIGEALLTPGSPVTTDCAEMTSLGLAISWSDRRLDDEKLASCATLSAGELKGKLGTAYDISIFLNGEHVLGENVDNLRPILTEITRVRKVVSLYNSTEERAGLAYLDIYVYR